VTPPDLHRSLSHRLRNTAAERGVDAARLRRHLVFQRILIRLAPSGLWVLKGGFCLEIRFDLSGRATQDLDMAFVGQASPLSAIELQELLAEELGRASLEDGFSFQVRLPGRLAARDLGTPGWRVKLQALVDNQPFEEIKLDVVEAPSEIAGGVEILTVEPVLVGAGLAAVEMPAVDIAQHAAEKVHAYNRIYALDRPSSRVKDLVDLVLLAEAGLLEPARWGLRLRQVFAVRDSRLPPATLPAPPMAWVTPYAAFARQLTITDDLQTGWRMVDQIYRAAIGTPPDEDHARSEPP